MKSIQMRNMIYDKLTDIKYIDELSSLFDNHKVNEKIMITLYTRSFVGGV